MLCWTPTYGTGFSQFITGHRRELAAWSNSSGVTHINISLPHDLFILTSCCSVGSQGSHHCCPFRIRLNIDHGHALTCPSIIPTPMCPFPWGNPGLTWFLTHGFLGPARVHVQNGTSIDSTISQSSCSCPTADIQIGNTDRPRYSGDNRPHLMLRKARRLNNIVCDCRFRELR